MRFNLKLFILFLVRFGLLSCHFEEIAAHSVYHMYSLNFDYISRFGFEGWIWVLIVSVPELCIMFTFIRIEQKKNRSNRQQKNSSLFPNRGN